MSRPRFHDAAQNMSLPTCTPFDAYSTICRRVACALLMISDSNCGSLRVMWKASMCSLLNSDQMVSSSFTLGSAYVIYTGRLMISSIVPVKILVCWGVDVLHGLWDICMWQIESRSGEGQTTPISHMTDEGAWSDTFPAKGIVRFCLCWRAEAIQC